MADLVSLQATGAYASPSVYLFEFDKRFGVFKEFIYYDFNAPCNLPRTFGDTPDLCRSNLG